MHKKRNSLILTIAIFMAFLACGVSFPHLAHAQNATCNEDDTDDGSPTNGQDLCQVDANGNSYPTAQYPNYNGGDPLGETNGLGGFGGAVQSGEFTNSFKNAAANVIGSRQYAKHTFMSNLKKVDAKLQYCFDSLKNIFKALNLTSTGNLVQKVVSALLSTILMALVGIVCSLISSIVSDLKTLVSAVNNLMCLPIPKLRLPRFHFPALGAGKCNGISLFQFSTATPGTGNTQKKVLWHIWGKDHEQ